MVAGRSARTALLVGAVSTVPGGVAALRGQVTRVVETREEAGRLVTRQSAYNTATTAWTNTQRTGGRNTPGTYTQPHRLNRSGRTFDD